MKLYRMSRRVFGPMKTTKDVLDALVGLGSGSGLAFLKANLLTEALTSGAVGVVCFLLRTALSSIMSDTEISDPLPE